MKTENEICRGTIWDAYDKIIANDTDTFGITIKNDDGREVLLIPTKFIAAFEVTDYATKIIISKELTKEK